MSLASWREAVILIRKERLLMTDLFEHSRKEQIKREAPLAARARPRTCAEFVGQE